METVTSGSMAGVLVAERFFAIACNEKVYFFLAKDLKRFIRFLEPIVEGD
jgi:hypothetical protein